MLFCKDLVDIKDDKVLKSRVPFQRPYFEYSDLDGVKEVDSSATSVADGKKTTQTDKIEVPVVLYDANGKELPGSKSETKDLYDAAVEYVTKKYGTNEDGTPNPNFDAMWFLLSRASVAESTAVRLEVRKANEEMSSAEKDAVILSSAKKLAKTGFMGGNVEKIKAFLVASAAAEAEKEAA